ncbi:hypothetical protein [Eubacterium sp.]|uniref:hypothetical protein n=1 Tax=Eubacterium sp. TaxID=142586 RepID=UPI0025F455EF|nr:hypothetical protein [Eubacterium sp.]MCR5629722.1 hypothetical protein [Eubacterium sp.]
MKKQLTIIPLLMVTILATSCSSKKHNFHQVKKVPITNTTVQETTTEVVYDQLFYGSEKNVEFTLFRSGDSYFLCRDNNSTDNTNKDGEVITTDWNRVEWEIPEEIKIKDFEFLHVKADLTILNGGEAGYLNDPVIDKVYEQKAMTYDEAMQKKIIDKYDCSTKYFTGPRIYENNGDSFIIVYSNYKNYRLYKNEKFMNNYTTAYDANEAMGSAKIKE